MMAGHQAHFFSAGICQLWGRAFPVLLAWRYKPSPISWCCNRLLWWRAAPSEEQKQFVGWWFSSSWQPELEGNVWGHLANDMKVTELVCFAVELYSDSYAGKKCWAACCKLVLIILNSYWKMEGVCNNARKCPFPWYFVQTAFLIMWKWLWLVWLKLYWHHCALGVFLKWLVVIWLVIFKWKYS